MKSTWLNQKHFLDASSHLYKRVCPSVGPCVCLCVCLCSNHAIDASSCPDGLVSLHSHAIRANVGGGTSSGGSGNQSGNRETNDINASAIASATLQQVRITVLSNAFAASQRKREFINASTSTLEGCRNHDADPHLYCHCNYGFVNAIVISFENLSLFCHCFCILTAVKGDN